MTGLLNRKLADPKFRAEFEPEYELLKLEIQILLAMEDKGWNYGDLAKAVGTSRQNIWRDLMNNGLQKASFDRICRMAEAVGLHFHPVLIKISEEKKILPKLKKLLKAA